MKQEEGLVEFKTLFRELYPEMVRIALFYLHDLVAAEDITQEVFTKLWEQCKMIDRIENIRGYLQYAVKNSCLNYLKHRRVVDKFEKEYLYQADEEEQIQEEYLNMVQRLVDQLPPKRKMVLEMSIVESKSYQEIAESMDLSINTVKDHIKKAYAFLRAGARREIPGYILYFILTGKSSKS